MTIFEVVARFRRVRLIASYPVLIHNELSMTGRTPPSACERTKPTDTSEAVQDVVDDIEYEENVEDALPAGNS